MRLIFNPLTGMFDAVSDSNDNGGGGGDSENSRHVIDENATIVASGLDEKLLVKEGIEFPNDGAVRIGKDAGEGIIDIENDSNISIGNNAGNSPVTTTFGNVSIGTQARKSSGGNYNVALGLTAGRFGVGSNNAIFGQGAGSYQIGSHNIYFGASTGYNAEGDYNVYFGYNVRTDTTTRQQPETGFFRVGCGLIDPDSQERISPDLLIGDMINGGLGVFGKVSVSEPTDNNDDNLVLATKGYVDANTGGGTGGPVSQLSKDGVIRVEATTSGAKIFGQLDVDGNQVVGVDDATASDHAVNLGQLQGAINAIPEGPEGPQGPQGPAGEKGEKGDKGDTGDTGPAGQDGADGANGAKGDKGDKGDTGDTGPAGQDGVDGAKGDKGDTGETGPQGPAGADGNDGADGQDGAKGDKGDTGDTGPQGPKGDKGDTGDVGPEGPQGPAGTPAESAVESVNNIGPDANKNVSLLTSDIPEPSNPSPNDRVKYVTQTEINQIVTNAGNIDNLESTLATKINEFDTGISANRNYVFQRNNFNGIYSDSWVNIDNLLNINAPVQSVHGRSGDVVAADGDYTSTQITETTSKQFISQSDKAQIGVNETNINSNANRISATEQAITTLDETKLDDTNTGINVNGNWFLNRQNTGGVYTDSWVPRSNYDNSQVDVGVTEIIAGSNVTVEEGSDGSVTINATGGGGGGGSSTYLDLDDTPETYGEAGFSAVVNETGDGLVYRQRKKQLTEDIRVEINFKPEDANFSDYATVQEAWDYAIQFDPGPYKIDLTIRNIDRCNDANDLTIFQDGGTWSHITITCRGTSQANTTLNSNATLCETALWNFDNCIAPNIGDGTNRTWNFSNRSYGLVKYNACIAQIKGNNTAGLTILNGTLVEGDSGSLNWNNTSNAVIKAERGTSLAMNGTTCGGNHVVGLRATGCSLVSASACTFGGIRHGIFISANSVVSASPVYLNNGGSIALDTNRNDIHLTNGGIIAVGQNAVYSTVRPKVNDDITINVPNAFGVLWDRSETYVKTGQLADGGGDFTAGEYHYTVNKNVVTFSIANAQKNNASSGSIGTSFLPEEIRPIKNFNYYYKNLSSNLEQQWVVKSNGNIDITTSSNTTTLDNITLTWICGD